MRNGRGGDWTGREFFAVLVTKYDCATWHCAQSRTNKIAKIAGDERENFTRDRDTRIFCAYNTCGSNRSNKRED